MKKKIHPEYKDATITCACGEVVHTRSTKQNIKVEICSKCHPFFSGKQKLVDAAGRVDIKKLLKTLAKRQISSVLVEGGAETITSFLRLGLADRLVVFIAPKVLGKGTDSVGELNITEISKALKLTFEKVYRSGEDIVVEARVG